MKFKRITNTSDIDFRLSWETYSTSFPEYEKRLLASHKKSISDPNFFANVIYDNNSYIGFIFFWKLESFIFIEHFAIDEKHRNKNYGSKIISKVLSNYYDFTILLEIDPPNKEIAIRRLNFYKRLGFVENNLVHYNLPYQNSLEDYRLELLSSNRAISKEEYLLFKTLLKSSACKYCE